MFSLSLDRCQILAITLQRSFQIRGPHNIGCRTLDSVRAASATIVKTICRWWRGSFKSGTDQVDLAGVGATEQTAARSATRASAARGFCQFRVMTLIGPSEIAAYNSPTVVEFSTNVKCAQPSIVLLVRNNAADSASWPLHIADAAGNQMDMNMKD